MANNGNRNMQILISAGIIVLLGLMYWLDRLTIVWERQARADFRMQPFILFSLLLPLIFVLITIFLSWLVLIRTRPGWITTVVCLLVGAGYLLLVVSIAFASPFTLQILEGTGLAMVSWVIMDVGSSSMLLQVAALVLVIGVISLVRMVRRPSTNFH